MSKQISVAMSLALALLLTGCKQPSSKSDILLVDIVEVEGNTSHLHAQYPGQTEAKENTDLSFKVAGIIEHVYVKQGDYVKQGQVLARLDSRDYETQLSATESEYRQVKAECERIIAMHAEHAVSDNNYDKARSGLERISAKLKNHRDQLSDCVILAPYSGYVSTVYRTDKEAAGPGLPVMGLFSSATAEVVINVPEDEYLRSKDAVCTATFATRPDQTFPLTIKSITQKANANQLFQMRLSLGKEAKDITPGMSVMVSITHESTASDSQVTVPNGAIGHKGNETFAYLYDEGSHTVRRVAVQTEALRTDGKTVISSGLQPGQQVVASGLSKLVDGQKVKPLQKPSPENVGKLL